MYNYHFALDLWLHLRERLWRDVSLRSALLSWECWAQPATAQGEGGSGVRGGGLAPSGSQRSVPLLPSCFFDVCATCSHSPVVTLLSSELGGPETLGTLHRVRGGKVSHPCPSVLVLSAGRWRPPPAPPRLLVSVVEAGGQACSLGPGGAVRCLT